VSQSKFTAWFKGIVATGFESPRAFILDNWGAVKRAAEAQLSINPSLKTAIGVVDKAVQIVAGLPNAEPGETDKHDHAEAPETPAAPPPEGEQTGLALGAGAGAR
jgi:hypothetical protein